MGLRAGKKSALHCDRDRWTWQAHTLLFALESDQRLERLLPNTQLAVRAASHLYQSVVFTARERSTIVARFLTYPALVGGLIHRRCQDRTWDSSWSALGSCITAYLKSRGSQRMGQQSENW